MKNYLSVLLLSVALLFASACKSTTPNGIAYKSLTTIAASVHVATDAYWNYRDANVGKIPNALDDKLKSAYQEYQRAFALAAIAEKALAPGSPPIDTSAVSNVAASFTALVSTAVPGFVPK